MRGRWLVARWFGLFILVLLVMALPTPLVHAATLTVRCVTTGGVPPPVSIASGCANLYSGIQAAVNAAASGDAILVFADSGATAASPTTFVGGITLTTAGTRTITGVGAVAITGGNNVLTVRSPSIVTLANLAITNGTSSLSGGGIANDGTLTLINVTVSGNTGPIGGGIYNFGGTLTLINTTLSGNTATTSGGTGGGGGLQIDNGSATVIHSTVTNNTTAKQGGGIYNNGRPLTLTNSLVAGNTAALSGNDLDGTAPTSTNNVVGLTTGLGTLADHGGPTQTVSIDATSPAHDNAACATNPVTSQAVATDQRDLPRPQGVTCDAGAFELTLGPTPPAFPVTVTTTALPSAPVNTAYNQNLVSTNGTPSYAYQLLSGSPPNGVTLAGDGTLNGTPTQAGIYSFTVQVTDKGDFTNLRAVTLNIGPLNLIVTNTNETAAGDANCIVGNCSLRQAVNLSNATDPGSGNHNTITFTPGLSGPIMLTNGTLTLTRNVTIDGTGATIAVDGNNAVRIFIVNSGVTATLSTLTIQHANAGIRSNGGGINNAGTLTVTNSTLAGNAGPLGGGIYNSGGTLTVMNSTFSANTVPNTGTGGGGIANAGTAVVTNTTFSGNIDNVGGGGGLYNLTGATLTLTNSTLSGNTAPSGGGGGILNRGGLTLTNTLIATSPGGGDLVQQGGSLTGSYNLIDDAATGTGFTDNDANHNIVGHPALLGPLGVYGNPTGTQSFPLLPGSLAINAGAAVGSGPPSAPVPATDQRGKPRVNAPDIGAFESQGFTINTNAPGSQPVNSTFPVSVHLSPNNPGEPVAGGQITLTVTTGGGGASATFPPNPATLDGNGTATLTFTANGIAGNYSFTPATRGAATIAPVPLINTPVGVNDADTVNNGSLTIAAPGVLANDLGGPLTAQIVTPPAHAATFILNADGSFTYTPATGFSGSEPFTYQAHGNDGTLSNTTTVLLTVVPTQLTGITITGPGSNPAPSTKVGQTIQLTAMGTFGSNPPVDITAQVQWISHDTTRATVDPTSGKVTGLSPGPVTITASLNGITQPITVTVGTPTPIGIPVPPLPPGRTGNPPVAPPGGPTPAPIPIGR